MSDTKKYEVIIEATDEACDEVYLREEFDDLDEAWARYGELRGEFLDPNGGWADGLTLLLNEAEGSTSFSLERECK